MDTLTSLIVDARNVLNHRSRGAEARLARLEAAGIPTDQKGLSRWLSSVLDAELEATGGVYHCCTVRLDNGADPHLPTHGKIGCRISRVPIKARLIETDEDDQPLDPYWEVQGGDVGVGYVGTRDLPFAPDADGTHACATEEQAESLVRRQLLASPDCVATRAEAEVLVRQMLEQRAGVARDRKA